MTIVPNIRSNVFVPFPASVGSSGPITIAKQNGVWTVSLSAGQLTSLPANFNPANLTFLVQNTATGIWSQLPVGQTGAGRQRLTGPLSLYIDVAGNDTTGDGSINNPWATFAHADSILRSFYDFNGQRIDLIFKSPGTYTGGLGLGGYFGGGTLSIHGATNAPASYVVRDVGIAVRAVFEFDNATGTLIAFDNLTFKPTTNSTDCLWVNSRTSVIVAANFGDGLGQSVICDFSSDVNSANGFLAGGGAFLQVFGTVNVTVPPTQKINTFFGCFGFDDNNSGATLCNHGATIIFSNNLRTNQFVFVDSASLLIDGSTFSFTLGSATAGARFFAETDGMIQTFGAGLAHFPGATNGSLASGAQYL